MKSSAQPRGDVRNVVAMDHHALGTLQYIRASMEAAGSLAVPGLAGIAMGAIGLTAAAITALPRVSRHWLLVWLVAALCAAPVGGLLLIRRSGLTGRVLRSGVARRFILCLSPSLVVAVVLTYVLWEADRAALIPGMWLLLYGCGIVAAGTVTIVSVSVMGALFMVLGGVAFLAPPAWSNALLGAGFGGLHLTFGWLLGRSTDVH